MLAVRDDRSQCRRSCGGVPEVISRVRLLVITGPVRYSCGMFRRSSLAAISPAYLPLHLAGCVAWFATTIGIWDESAQWQAVAGVSARSVAIGLLGLFLAAFVAILVPAAGDRLRRRVARIVAVMVTTTLALMLLGGSNFTPILLIISAVVIASNFGPRTTAVMLLACSAIFYCVARWLWHVSDALLLVVIYGSFEAFAAVSSQARARSESAAMELRELNAALLSTRALLAESARDTERLRVSRELHDVTGHKLTALNLNLQLLRHDGDLATRPELVIASQLGEELLADIRAVVSRLRSDDGIDLREALQRLVEPFPRPAIRIDVPKDLRVSDTQAAEVLLRAAQEGLTNSVRHSNGHHIYLSLQPGPGRVELVVEDDGHVTGSYRAGNGLTGLHERVEAIGGSVRIDRPVAGGWRLTVQVPCRSPG